MSAVAHATTSRSSSSDSDVTAHRATTRQPAGVPGCGRARRGPCIVQTPSSPAHRGWSPRSRALPAPQGMPESRWGRVVQRAYARAGGCRAAIAAASGGPLLLRSRCASPSEDATFLIGYRLDKWGWQEELPPVVRTAPHRLLSRPHATRGPQPCPPLGASAQETAIDVLDGETPAVRDRSAPRGRADRR